MGFFSPRASGYFGQPKSSIKHLKVKIVSAETTSEMTAKTTLGCPLLVAATLINCIRRLDVILRPGFVFREERDPASY